MTDSDVAAVLTIAVQRLEGEGFERGAGEFVEKVQDMRSGWVAQDLYLGDIRKSWRGGAVEWFTEGTGLDLFVPFWRGATPTLIVACARATREGTELVIASHVSVRGGADSNDAAPLLRRSWDALEQRFRADGVFVSREKLWKIENDGSPASQKVVRDLIGWR